MQIGLFNIATIQSRFSKLKRSSPTNLKMEAKDKIVDWHKKSRFGHELIGSSSAHEDKDLNGNQKVI